MSSNNNHLPPTWPPQPGNPVRDPVSELRRAQQLILQQHQLRAQQQLLQRQALAHQQTADQRQTSTHQLGAVPSTNLGRFGQGLAAVPLPPHLLDRPIMNNPAPPVVPAASVFDSPEEDEDQEDGEVSEGGEDEEDDAEAHEEDDDPYPWHALREDNTLPCADEIKYIESKPEHSALDHAHWEKQTFFDLADPEFTPQASGRIEWLVEGFNGTAENPNKQLVMLSPTVRIGDHDWRIKLYPRGNSTEYLSLYVESPTVGSDAFPEQRDFKHIPLPVMATTPKLKQLNTLAVQVSVIMYNPAEPRVYEFQQDAWQYSRKTSDFGWRYFTRGPRHAFHQRQHGQRQAILRNDRLAFTAYIRIIDDPTGCLWRPIPTTPEASILSTSLRPLETNSAASAAILMLLHVRSVRIWFHHAQGKQITKETDELKHILHRFYIRKLKQKHLLRYGVPEGCDVVQVLDKLIWRHAKNRANINKASICAILFGLVHEHQHVAHHRLETEQCTSVQQAIDRLARPLNDGVYVLLLELKRRTLIQGQGWQKITNPIQLENHILYGTRRYTLLGFICHKGALGSGQYTTFVRPHGPAGLWYKYDANKVTCLTQKAAHAAAMGLEVTTSSKGQTGTTKSDEIAYLAWYIRGDNESMMFNTTPEEPYVHPPAAAVLTPKALSNPQPPSAPVQWGAKPVQAVAGAVPGTRSVAVSEDAIMSDVDDETPPPKATLAENVHTKTSPIAPPKPIEKTLDFYCGNQYQGQVVKGDIYHGAGRLMQTNGDAFVGNFANGKPHGYGEMRYNNGDIYEGQWDNGQHHGHGKFSDKKTGNVYEGGFDHGRRHGAFVLRGTVTEEDQDYCQICYTNVINTAFFDCGHTMACKQCAKAVTQCPVCRKQIAARVELFGVKISMQ